MWHEARKQEKLVRSKLVDSAKRHERRKNFYESIRKDPEEFMQIHGRKATIHVDPSVAQTAESGNILRKWQGDPNVLIDRFDARSHLDQITEVPKSDKQQKPSLTDDIQELQCEYERYRVLIFNEFLKFSEKSCLQKIATKEFWPSYSTSIHKKELEKKKKTVDKKAAIGFSYDNSETVPGSSARDQKSKFGTNGNGRVSDSESDEEELIEEEEEEVDRKIDADVLTPEQGSELSKIGGKYNVMGPAGIFLKLCRMDKKEQEDAVTLREIDKAKLALSGRHAKADRAVLKRRRAMIVGKVTHSEDTATTTLLSFLEKKDGCKSEAVERSDSESSSSEDGILIEKTEFITSFGGDDHEVASKPTSGGGDDDSGMVVHGPALPNREYIRLLELKHLKEHAEEEFKDPYENYRQRSRTRNSRSYSRTSIAKREIKRSRSRSRSHHDRKRSRSRSREGTRYSRSNRKSRSRSRKRDDRRRSNSRNRSRYRSSSSSSSRSNHRLPGKDIFRERVQVAIRGFTSEPTPTSIASSVLSKDFPHQRKRSRSRSNRSDSSCGSHKESVRKPCRNVTRSSSPGSIHSSMSESEKERIEIDNRKRRIRKTQRKMTQRCGRNRSNSSSPGRKSEKKAHTAAQKLRQQMQKALKKTAAQLKADEEERVKDQERERKIREEQLLEEARILRRREREKEREPDKDDREKQSTQRAYV